MRPRPQGDVCVHVYMHATAPLLCHHVTSGGKERPKGALVSVPLPRPAIVTEGRHSTCHLASLAAPEFSVPKYRDYAGACEGTAQSKTPPATL